MAFNVEEFLTQISQRGTIKTSKFEVGMNLPPCWDSDPNLAYYNSLIRDVGLRCDRAAIPGIVHQTFKYRRYGYGTTETVPLVPNFDDAQLSFISDAEGDFWRLFQKWMNKISNSDTGSGIWNGSTERVMSRSLYPYDLSYKSDYATQIVVTWYSDDGIPVKNIVLNEAFPTAISEIKLDWADGQNIARFIVNFSAQDFYLEEIETE